ncbi:MAG: hypothetical protein ACR2LU_09260 [Luteitalea sp.]
MEPSRGDWPPLCGHGRVLAGARHVVAAIPLQRTPLVVEQATYGRSFAAGSASLATRLPDPED